MLTRGELDAATAGTAVAVIVAVLLAAALFRWQAGDIADLRARLDEQDADLDAVWAWCTAAAETLGWTDDDDPGPGGAPGPDDPGPDDGPATVVSHPADMEARKLALLSRYAHIGQHRQ